MSSLKPIKVEPPGECGEVDTKPCIKLEQCAGPDSNIESVSTGKESKPHCFISVPSNGCPVTGYVKPMCEECGKGLAVHMVSNVKGHHQKCCPEVTKKSHAAELEQILAAKDAEIGLLKAQLQILSNATQVPDLSSPGRVEDFLRTIEDHGGPSTSYATRSTGANVGGNGEGSDPGNGSNETIDK